MFVIYAIVNLFNNKVYIGKTNDFRKRKNSHFSELRNKKHKNKHLQNAWNKYGSDSFKIEVIDKTLDHDDLSELEMYYIKLAKSYDGRFGYNLTYGGEGARLNEELKAATSKRLKGVPKSEEHKKKIQESHLKTRYWKGKKLSQNHVEKIRYSLFRQVQTEETKRKRAIRQTGAGNHRFGKPASNVTAVDVFDLSGNFIKSFDSQKIASIELKIPKSSISGHLLGKLKTACGYIIKYKKDKKS